MYLNVFNHSCHELTWVCIHPLAYRVLSNKEQRRLYDRVGHKAFLKNEEPLDSDDDYQTNFHFGFPDFFHDFDDSPFGGEWRFHQEEEDGHYGHYSFERQKFTFFFGDADEYEDEYYYWKLFLYSEWLLRFNVFIFYS